MKDPPAGAGSTALETSSCQERQPLRRRDDGTGVSWVDLTLAELWMRMVNKASTAGVMALALLGCRAQAPDPTTHGSASLRLRPVTTPLSEPSLRRTVYVAIYSSIALGDARSQEVLLSSTLSVRNVSSRHPIVLEFVRYYDSGGRHVRDYIPSASELPPLATVEFVVLRSDAAGGPGANFLIGWAGPDGVDEPLIEAVMVGQAGNAGISFTSQGRVVKDVQ